MNMRKGLLRELLFEMTAALFCVGIDAENVKKGVVGSRYRGKSDTFQRVQKGFDLC